MGLMKLATYYRMVGDDVRFFKGDLRDLATDLICEDLINYLSITYPNVFWKAYYLDFCKYIRIGRNDLFPQDNVFENEEIRNIMRIYRKKYKEKDYFKNPRFDKVGITTLFTFYWQITIDTINFAKKLCKSEKDVMVGGIMSSLLPEEVFKETGIYPYVGLLDKPGVIDEGNELIIDELPLDYSILEEIDYVYPTHDAYFAYMTRGCINKCSFCAVPKLEPQYRDYIGLQQQIVTTRARFGEKRDLMLLDNNVLASHCYDRIIDEIYHCGFYKGAKCSQNDEYGVAIRNLRDGYNDRAYIRKIIKIYKDIIERLTDEDEKVKFYNQLEEKNCLHYYTATVENILSLDDFARELYEKTHTTSTRRRIIDFNQGIDSRLINDENMNKLSTVNIYPLRIAFDHWELRDIYEKSVRTAVKNGIRNLSNYLLYNFEDKPEHLYYRLRMNVELCEELGASIYSFPMKYHPINDPDYFRNRNYIGKHWNRKFIRAIQAILNSTKGKIGKGRAFFYAAFGKDVDEFYRILWMPEAFIIYRARYDARLRKHLGAKYTPTEFDCDLANEWWEKFSNLTKEQRSILEKIVAKNCFNDDDYDCKDAAILDILGYYKISRK